MTDKQQPKIKGRAVKIDTSKPKDETPTAKDLSKAEKLARRVSPLMAELFSAKEKKEK